MPNLKKNIFNKKKLNNIVSRIEKNSIPDLKHRLECLNEWINYIVSGNIDLTKETALQGRFLDDIFSKVLGYKSRFRDTEEWNLNQEQLTTIDSKFADGSLGYFSKTKEDVRVVIELKGSNINLDVKQHRQNDTRTPIEQAFSYQHKIGSKCRWIIVSNFKEIRLYHNSSSTEYEEFIISELGNWEQFRRFYFLLSVDNLISIIADSIIDSLYAKNEVDEVNISKQFYLDFKKIRLNLFEHLKQNNPDRSGLLLLEKAQKFLDRFIFLCFCEDNRLLPEKTFKHLIETGKKSFSYSETKIWDELKGLFHAINVGSPPHNINKFNGGLFATDSELDKLIIKDGILEEVGKLTEYDFETDVDVNILGHIFEQSISDIEELKAGIEGKVFDKKTSKRKKDGIYYTPEFITRYIVENAVGGWLEDRKKELGFYELPDLPSNSNKGLKSPVLKKHLDFWQAYKVELMNIKVLDQACGSGAFLNQAFNFLYAEGQYVNDKIAELSGGQTDLFGLDKHILSNNLFGVDLNSESVEITKLSLWIKTANAYNELTALDNNIKCGNSLIDDPKVAGDKAFNWFKEFPSVFPGYRDYTTKKSVSDYQHLTIEEIRERNLQEPRVNYSSDSESINDSQINEPSYSYKADSKGFLRHGFDVVISNPPWGGKLNRTEIEFISNTYNEILSGEIDTYFVFIIRCIKLMKYNGFLGFIIPDTWLSLQKAYLLRKFIYENMEVIDIFDRYKPFEDAKDTRSHTIIMRRSYLKDYNIHVSVSNSKSKIIKDSIINSSELKDFKEWNIYKSDKESQIFQKMFSRSMHLNELYSIKYGLRTGNNKKYLSNKDINGLNLKVARGSHIQRYYFDWSEEYLTTKENLPISYFNSATLKEKIILQYVRTNSTDLNSRWLEATIIEELNYIPLNSTTFIYEKSKFKLKYLLPILSSNLMNFYYKAHYTDVNVKPIYLEKLPVPAISLQQPFIELADIMLNKNKELQSIKNDFLTFIKNKFRIIKPSTKLQNWYELEFNEFLKELTKAKVILSLDEQFSWQSLFSKQKAIAQEITRTISETDKKIDSMVYELYSLTDEEIRIVEGN